jgi:hypothetical protein
MPYWEQRSRIGASTMRWMLITAAFAIGALLLVGKYGGGLATRMMLRLVVTSASGGIPPCCQGDRRAGKVPLLLAAVTFGTP